MTEQEFLALEPRERDGLVAEKVMKLEWLKHPDGYEFRPDLRLEHYTTNIFDAWQVVEKMRKMGWTLKLHEDRTPEWCAVFWDIPYRHNPSMAYTNTAPLAICIAALKAKGEIK